MEIERPLPLYLDSSELRHWTPWHTVRFPSWYRVPDRCFTRTDSLPCSQLMVCRPTESERHLGLMFVEECIAMVSVPSMIEPIPSAHFFCIRSYPYWVTVWCNNTIMIVNEQESSLLVVHGDSFMYKTNGNVANEYRFGRKGRERIHIQWKKGTTMMDCLISDSTARCMIQHEDKKKEVTIRLQPDRTEVSSYYTRAETHCRTRSHSVTTKDRILHVMNKNGLLIQSDFDRTTNTERLISKCMITGSDGIRFRGACVTEIKQGAITKKTLTKDDTTVFDQDETGVIVDTLRTKRTRTEMVIGWKVAKSATGEVRIVKLGIPTEAEIVMPVDYEFFLTRGKERCTTAIVMDIQLPTVEEQSVVPNEMTAYSYVYKEQGAFPYPVGSVVVPDNFNPDENESCAQGIHFYQNRADLLLAFTERP